MLRVRVMSPADTTGRLLEALDAEPGVRNVVVLRGMARRPDGDAVEFDVRQGAANAVFRLLRGLHLDRPGAVTAGEATRSWPTRRVPVARSARRGVRSPRSGNWWRPPSERRPSTPRAFSSCSPSPG